MNPLALFRGASLLTQAGVVVGAVLAAGAAYAGWHHHVYRQGWNAAVAAIARADKEAIDAALAARATYRACVDAGGVWDPTRGQCRRR